MKRAIATIILAVLVIPMLFVSTVSAPPVGFSDNGILVEQWHYDMQSMYSTILFGSSSAIVDLGVNNVGGEPNSDLEIIVGSDEFNNFYPELGASANGIWRVLDSQGNLEWAKDTGTDESRSSPTIADLDGDNDLEIIAGTTSGWNVEVMDHTGGWVWTFPWPPTVGGPFMWHSSPAVADIDSTLSGLEVVIANRDLGSVWAFDGDNSDNTDDGITVTPAMWGYGPPAGIEGTNWDALWVFSTAVSPPPPPGPWPGDVSTPALGDVDNDGVIEVVIGSTDNNIYILNGITGALEWSYTTGGPVYASAATANLDADPYLEIVIGSTDGNIYCLEWNGAAGSLQWSYSTGSPVHSSAAIGDIDGDGALEIVDASTNGNVYALDTSGLLEWMYSTGSSTDSSPALADRSSVTPYDRDWPMFRHDPMRTGLYGPSPGPQGLDVYIGADDHYLYLIEGGGAGGGSGGTPIDRFLTYGRLYTSPSVADIDGDSRLEIVLYDADPGRYDAVQMRNEYTYWCIEDKMTRTLDKRIHKKVKVIPAPVQFWREFIGGVTDIIVSDPPDWPPEGVALVREYTVLHNEGHIPLELLTWEGTEGLPWESIDTPEEPYILLPGESAEYDIPTVETDTAVLVRYTVAWASTPNIIEAHFINEAILESKSPQVIVGQLSNFDVHNDYHEPVNNFELELYGIQPSDVVDWFPGWGTPPEINPIPPSGGMPGGTEIIWMDPDQPVLPCNWEHFGLHLKPGVIATGVKAYWTQVPSAELGDVIHTKIEVTVPHGETATVVDTLPSMVGYITGTFTVDGVPATPTITKIGPPPKPSIHKISYTITTPGTHVIEFDVKVDEAKNWEDTEVCNVATATWYDEAGEIIETKEDVECFTIHPFEELHKNIGIPKADVVFTFDLTGSMGPHIASAKSQASAVISAVQASVGDAAFGVLTHVDYPYYYSNYHSYSGQYGELDTNGDGIGDQYGIGDYAYKTDLDITTNHALATLTIAGLSTYWGADGPQDYTRVLYETQFLTWRPNAKKIVVMFGDNIPHDDDFWTYSTGGDPGPDAIAGNADDLDFQTVVSSIAGQGITVLAVDCSVGGWAATFYQYLATQTGGQYFLLGATGIPEMINELVKAEAQETLVIKEKTNVQWAVVMDVVNPFSYTMTNVEITDRFGAEIEIDPPFPYSITHGTASYYTEGASEKVFLTWNIGNLLPGETARLIILVSTDTNPSRGDCNKDGVVDVQDAILAFTAFPQKSLSTNFDTSVYPYADHDENGIDVLDAITIANYFGGIHGMCAGKQEYTEPGIYELNSGATLKFVDPEQNMQLSACTDTIYVTVLPEGDC